MMFVFNAHTDTLKMNRENANMLILFVISMMNKMGNVNHVL